MPKNKQKRGFFIKNILVIGKKAGNGEYLSGPYVKHKTAPDQREHVLILDDGKKDPSRSNRIVKQISAIADYAKSQHNIYRFTQIVTDEFSFFTRSTPLTLDEYQYIINETSEALKSLPPNIILIISSMAVLWSDGSLRNAVLHIQSPNDNQSLPIIHHFSKEYVSEVDPRYNNVPYDKSPDFNSPVINPYNYKKDDYNCPIHSPNIVLKNSRVQRNDPNQYKSAILVQGYQLPPKINVTGICLDHSKHVEATNVDGLLKTNRLAVAVFHINHIITSRTTEASEIHMVANAIHADVDHKKVGNSLLKKEGLLITSHFGALESVYLYHQSRVEVLNSSHFIFASLLKNSTPIQTIVDNHNNTLLHQILLQDKRQIFLPKELFFDKQFAAILLHFDSNTIDQQNKDGNTPLHLVLIRDSIRFDTIKSLLKKNAKLNIKNNMGMTPIEWAFWSNKPNGLFVIFRIAHDEKINLEISQQFAEKLIILAYSFKNPSFLEHIQTQLPQPINVEMIKQITENDKEKNQMQQWFYRGLIKIQFKKENNIGIIVSLLSNLTNWYENSGIGGNNIAEQSIAHAYTLKNAEFLISLKPLLKNLWNVYSIEKIASSFHLLKVHALGWLSLEIIKNELKQGKDADLNVILPFLPKLRMVELHQPSQINSINIAEALLIQSYVSNDYHLLNCILDIEPFKSKSDFSEIITKVSNASLLPVLTQQWYLKGIIRSEYEKNFNAKLDLILFCLQNLIDKQEPLFEKSSITIAECMLYLAFWKKNNTEFLQKLYPYVSHLYNPASIEAIVKFSVLDKDDFKKWIQPEIEKMNPPDSSKKLDDLESKETNIVPEVEPEVEIEKPVLVPDYKKTSTTYNKNKKDTSSQINEKNYIPIEIAAVIITFGIYIHVKNCMTINSDRTISFDLISLASIFLCPPVTIISGFFSLFYKADKNAMNIEPNPSPIKENRKNI